MSKKTDRAKQISALIRKIWLTKYGDCMQGNCHTVISMLSRRLKAESIRHTKKQVWLNFKNGNRYTHWLVELNDGTILDPAAWYEQDSIVKIEDRISQSISA